LGIVTLTFSTNLLACDEPIQSDEFDNLIRISSNSIGEHIINFPSHAGGQQYEHVAIQVANSSNQNSNVYATLNATKTQNGYSTSVSSFATKGLDVKVVVWWQGGLNPCPIIGAKKIVAGNQ